MFRASAIIINLENGRQLDHAQQITTDLYGNCLPSQNAADSDAVH